MRRHLADTVFHPTSCEYYNLCDRFKALLGLPGQLFVLSLLQAFYVYSNLSWFN